MPESLIQLGLAAFGLTAMWWAQGHNARLRRLSPLVGLVGQVFWCLFALSAQDKGVNVGGLWALIAAFTVVYIRGVAVQWRGR